MKELVRERDTNWYVVSKWVRKREGGRDTLRRRDRVRERDTKWERDGYWDGVERVKPKKAIGAKKKEKKERTKKTQNQFQSKRRKRRKQFWKKNFFWKTFLRCCCCEQFSRQNQNVVEIWEATYVHCFILAAAAAASEWTSSLWLGVYVPTCWSSEVLNHFTNCQTIIYTKSDWVFLWNFCFGHLNDDELQKSVLFAVNLCLKKSTN